MENGEQMPKATMTNFIKDHVDMGFSAQFVMRMLALSKEYIVRLSDKSNQICLHSNKKTINVDHLEKALADCGLVHHLDSLKNVGQSLREMHQLKRETNQRIEEDLERERKNQQALRQGQPKEQRIVELKAQFDQIELAKDKDASEEEDYDALDHPNPPSLS